MQKEASLYSNPWKNEKMAPNNTVVVRLSLAWLRFPFRISWWDQVTVTPEDKSRIVFSSGTLIGLNDVTE